MSFQGPWVAQDFVSLNIPMGSWGSQKPFAWRRKGNRGGELTRSRSALSGQRLENAPEVTDASAGNRLRIRTKVEGLDRDIALISVVHQGL